MGWHLARTTPTATRVSPAPAVALAFLTFAVVPGGVRAAEPHEGAQPPGAGRASRADAPAPDRSKTRLGVYVNDPRASPGYTLVFPLRSTRTNLIDLEGRVVRTWQSKYTAGQDAYLLENGHLLRAAKLGENEAFFAGAGAGGRVQEFTWDGKLVWDFKFHNEKQTQHHAITRMPNGNVMLIVWERKTAKESIEAGVKPELAGGTEILVDSLAEVQPAGKTGGKVVWEWHLWDHLIQDHDKTKANYGDVAAHPELVDVNFGRSPLPTFDTLARFVDGGPKPGAPKTGDSQPSGLDKLKGIGYVGASGGKKFVGFIPDWTHVNAVAYNPKLDQLMLTCREFSEIWVIDHSTTRAEAAGHTGGKSGRGGDLLYRWGNPRAHRAGQAADQRLFAPHDGHWIPDGVPGAGHVLVFNNGGGRADGHYSSVDEIVPPVDGPGRYACQAGTAFRPDKPVWSYTAEEKKDFFAPLMSGAQRLANGNTLICTGLNGTIFEVTPEKEVVWRYVPPAEARQVARPGAPGGGSEAGPLLPVQLLPPFVQTSLHFTPDQTRQLDQVQKATAGRIEKMLTEGQKKELQEIRGAGGRQRRGGAGGPPKFGLVMPEFLQEKLQLTAEQKKQLAEFQKDADAALAQILTGEQKEQLKGFEEMLRALMAGGPPGFGPGGAAGPGSVGRPGGSPVFRAYRYPPSYPGLAGKDLTPKETVAPSSPKTPGTK